MGGGEAEALPTQSGTGGGGGGNSSGKGRPIKEFAILFFKYVVDDVERKRKCANRRELEAEFMEWRRLAGAQGTSLPPKQRSFSSMMFQLRHVLRLVRVSGDEVTFEALSTPRVARAVEAAAQLMQDSAKFKNRDGVSIEPEPAALESCFVPVGEELQQTILIKIDAQRRGAVTLSAAFLMKRECMQAVMRLELPPDMSLPVELAPGTQVCISVCSALKQPGVLSNVVALTFLPTDGREFTIIRRICVRAGVEEIEQLLKPVAPYTRARAARRPSARQVQEGEAPAAAGITPYVHALENYAIPPLLSAKMDGPHRVVDELLGALQEKMFMVQTISHDQPETFFLNDEMAALFSAVYTSKLAINSSFSLYNTNCKVCAKAKEHHCAIASLTGTVYHFCKDPKAQLEQAIRKQYSELYSHLLWAEEWAMRIDIRAYDLDAAPLEEQPGGCLLLRVPGLSENRPSVLRGDTVLVYPPWQTEKVYKGYAHRIERDGVMLRFSREFHGLWIRGMRAKVIFTFRRSNLRLCHQAVSQSVIGRGPEIRPLLFPSFSDAVLESQQYQPLAFSPFDRHLNAEQRRAVGFILKAHATTQRVPYVIFGPPGTGKTKTVCEAVLQLCRHRACCVLVTAPSNQAADLLLEKLSVHLNRNEMLRFMAFNRHAGQVSGLNIDYSYKYDAHEGVFLQPPIEKLLSFKVVIATCCMAAKLYNLGVPRGHFGRKMHTHTHTL